jgi:CheY-like chemotaxis protein
MLLYFAADLLWATRIKALANDLGLAARPVRNLEMLHARLAEGGVRGVVVDLDAPEVALQLIARLKGEGASEQERAIRVLAWGPHVQKDLFQQARDAGADEVMTRGAFDHALAEILTRFSA